jgi:hypothetical protein
LIGAAGISAIYLLKDKILNSSSQTKSIGLKITNKPSQN